MNIKMGLLGVALTIIFIIIFAEIIGKDPITFFKDSSIAIKFIMIFLLLLLIFKLVKEEFK